MEKTYKILKLLIWILAFAVVIVGAYVLYNRLSSEISAGGIATVTRETGAPEATELPGETASATEERGSEAPDFTVYDREGNPHKLSDFRGTPVLLNFWASWCGPCQMEMPDFQKYFESHGDKVSFVIVNLTDGQQETVESASAFIAENGYSFPVYYDTDLDATYSYNTSGLPVTYFLDAEGNFVAWKQGMLTAESLQTGIDMLLS